MFVNIIYNIPTWLLGFLLLTLITLFSLFGLILTRKIFNRAGIEMNNEIVNGLGGQAAVIFAVVAGFIAISVWTNFDKASAIVREEADQIFDIWLNSKIYPPEFQNKVRHAVEEYLHIIIDDEWYKQSQGQSSNDAENVLEQFYDLLIEYTPSSEAQQSIHNQIVVSANNIFYDRRSRIHVLTLDPAVYYSILCSMLVVLALAWCFQAKDFRSHVIVTALITIGAALVLFLIVTFDHPFRGEVSISSEPFQRALLHIHSLKSDTHYRRESPMLRRQ